MTKISIFKKNDAIYAFQIKGHSGYADEGSDIVCSAISVASQMTLVGLEEVLKVSIEKKVEDGFMLVKILDKFEDKSVQTLLKSLELTLKDIAHQYSKFVKLEVKRDVY